MWKITFLRTITVNEAEYRKNTHELKFYGDAGYIREKKIPGIYVNTCPMQVREN